MRYDEMTSDQLQEALIELDKVISGFDDESEELEDKGLNPYLMGLYIRRKFIIEAFIENFGYNPDNLMTKDESDLNSIENQSPEK